MATTITAAASRQTEATSATAHQADRLLTAQDVMQRLGLKCKTSHTALILASRGSIVAVRINQRVVRFTESSVNALIAGKVAS